MKRILAAGMLSLLSFQATAGSITYEAPAPITVVEPSMGSGAWIIPLVILSVLALAISQKGGGNVITQPSDARLKTNIKLIGVADNGLPLYSFRYVGSSQYFTGVMAQDVLSHTPEAVFVGPFGYMGVNYEMLGLEMQPLN
jgi:hypothetical protein